MMHPNLAASAPASPMERQSVIEIDTFCTGCFYNLHGQIVSIDERLEIPVCRCPECGKFHPAGTGVTASGMWLRRFASMLLFGWIVMVFLGFLGVTAIMAGIDAASIGLYAYTYEATADNQPVKFSPGPKGGGYVLVGTNTPVQQIKSFVALRPWYLLNTQYDAGLVSMLVLCAASLFLGFIAGILGVSLMWHWPRRRYAWGISLPFVSAALVSIPFLTDSQLQFIHGHILRHIASQMGIQLVGLMLGIIFGRSLARLLVRMVVPPKPRQALAFLWRVDGKAPPPA